MPAFAPSRTPARRSIGRDLLAASALLAAVAIFWRWRFMAPARTYGFASVDLFLYFLPMREAVYGALATGRLPLWNPYQLCGIPLLATLQVGAFYPLHALHLVLPPAQAMAATAVLHIVLATLGSYALVRTLGLSTTAGLVAAFTYGLSGRIMQTTLFPNYQEAAAWLPIGLLALARLARSPRVGGWLVLWAVAEASPLLAGHAQLWVVLNYVWGAAALYLAAALGRRAGTSSAVRFVLVVAVGAVLGAALTAVQALPTAELARESTRPPENLAKGDTNPYGGYFPWRLALRNAAI